MKLTGKQAQQDATISILDKRQRITEARVARLTENEKGEQRKSVETMLDMRGLWIPDSKRLASAQEREATLKSVAEHLRLDLNQIKRTHGPPGRMNATDKTRLTFDAVDDLRE